MNAPRAVTAACLTAACVLVGGLGLVGCAGGMTDHTADPVIVSDPNIDVNALPIGEFTLWWDEPGELLHIYFGGSGVEACNPTPVEVVSDGDEIEMRFDLPAGNDETTCSGDLHPYLYEAVFAEPFEVTGAVNAHLVSTDGGDERTVSIDPEPFAPEPWPEY